MKDHANPAKDAIKGNYLWMLILAVVIKVHLPQAEKVYLYAEPEYNVAQELGELKRRQTEMLMR